MTVKIRLSGVEGGTTVAEQVEYNNFLWGYIAYSDVFGDS
jgi:hypothetical protein